MKLKKLLSTADEADPVDTIIDEAIEATIADADEKDALTAEFADFREELGDFKFALCRPYFGLHEKKQAGSGGLPGQQQLVEAICDLLPFSEP